MALLLVLVAAVEGLAMLSPMLSMSYKCSVGNILKQGVRRMIWLLLV